MKILGFNIEVHQLVKIANPSRPRRELEPHILAYI